ncbi:hypothetical protein [Streptomyces sp. NPDC057677]|uniref:hypothetical protein n=1 Tax=unclassified Streptomyces TaxID=2593676 RepID=UPI003685EBBA
MHVVRATYLQVRGLMKESEGKALRDSAMRAEGRRMRDEARQAREERQPRPPG